MEAPYSQSSWGDPHVAERAEAILDRIAQNRLRSTSREHVCGDLTPGSERAETQITDGPSAT